MKEITLPRLELQGALLLAKLAQKVKAVIKDRLNAEFYWCDSQVALTWIRGPPTKWKVFISNRTQQIQQLTDAKDWYYVKSASNPADLVSRGITIGQLIGNKKTFWINGPEFLVEGDYPQDQIDENLKAPEEKVKSVSVATANVPPIDDYIAKFKYHNSFKKTRRHFALVKRIIENWKAKSPTWKRRGISNKYLSGAFTPQELNEGTKLIIQIMQQQEYPTKLAVIQWGETINKDQFEHLNPTMQNGLLHVTGRLSLAELPLTHKTPILIPKSHPFAKVIIRYIHERNFHCGLELVMSEFRRTYWMRNLRKVAEGVINKCVKCARARPRRLQQHMGQLPRARVNPSSAFTHTGVDLCGPFEVL
ncbi:uncharacterized protein LOC129774084 [Toxorhynchites rutilus septentrionalis]|uniref:uncharacterized protein LOC129774084 n=1 Tax=Toxorhynchites rutilus septentrionalis TaxID=329112 RepID=UPI0024790B0E|nr:uncharacterized protein LOC129774084 [Toxorhynchites rutilus septentrionalis]